MQEQTIKVIANFRVFDRDQWHEFELEEVPPIIYPIKRRVKMLSGNDKRQIEGDKNQSGDTTLFWEISVDKKNGLCWIVKYIWAREMAFPQKRRYKGYGTKIEKGHKLNVVRTDQVI